MVIINEEKCIGCQICKKVCPVDAIQGQLKEAHVVIEDRCVECHVCGHFCPKGAISDSELNEIQKKNKNELSKPTFHTDKCSACQICVEICSFDCIEVSKPKFKGDIDVFAKLENSEKCVGCGLCELYCPIHVITMEVPR